MPDHNLDCNRHIFEIDHYRHAIPIRRSARMSWNVYMYIEKRLTKQIAIINQSETVTILSGRNFITIIIKTES